MAQASLHPETAAEALAKWDADESVFTVEMGGLGPGYEQAIHIGVFEMLRRWQGREVADWKSWPAEYEADLADVSREKQLGLSGAQAGAIMNLAYRYLRDGYRATLESLSEDMKDRLIQVTKNTPQG